MFKLKSVAELLFALLCLLASGVTAPAQTASRNSDQASDNALVVARKELTNAANAAKVAIEIDRMSYVTDGDTTITQAPIARTRKYQDADFAAGAPILLMIVRSATRLAVPNGAYLIKAQYQPKGAGAKVVFTDRNGAVIARRELVVRTWEQSSALFPGAYPVPMPQEIPNITSTHILIIKNGVKKWYVDCAGEIGTLYFEMM